MLWEYLTHTVPTEGIFLTGHVDPRRVSQDLNRLGDDGWELVSAFDTSWAKGGSRLIVLIFKRPRILTSQSNDTPPTTPSPTESG